MDSSNREYTHTYIKHIHSDSKYDPFTLTHKNKHNFTHRYTPIHTRIYAQTYIFLTSYTGISKEAK